MPDYTFTGHNNELTGNARELRKTMTRQEKHLWYDFLRDYPVKFYRQRVIDHYIVDFYCSKAKLVIELDGSQHYTLEGKHYDAVRTEKLEGHDLYVLRFSNYDVDKYFNGVCDTIDAAVRELIERR